MQDADCAVERFAAGFEVAYVALDQLEATPTLGADVVFHLGQIVPVTGREIVEADDFLVEPEECFDEVRADEAGTARDEPPLGVAHKIRGQRINASACRLFLIGHSGRHVR